MTTITTSPGAEVRVPLAVENGEAALRRLGFKLGEHDRLDPLFRYVDLPRGWRPTGMYRSMPQYLIDEHRRRRAVLRYSGYPHLETASMRLVSRREYAVRCVTTGTPLIVDPTWATPQALLSIALEEIRRADQWCAHFAKSNLGVQANRYAELRGLWSQVAARFDVEAAA